MDMWKFFDITHREHILSNHGFEKLEQLVAAFRFPKPVATLTERVRAFIRLAERYRQMTGTRVDFSPTALMISARSIKNVFLMPNFISEMDFTRRS